MNDAGAKGQCMDAVTEEVKALYSQYPFPNSEYQLTYILKILHYFARLPVAAGRKSFFEGAGVLDAGCGTGTTITLIARMQPKAAALGVDLSAASLAIAEAHRRKLGLANLGFREGNILDMDLGKKFDVVLSLGVLHHLADMPAGLDNLVRHLKDDGVLLLWLYGKYGRQRLNLNQRFFRILLQGAADMKEKVRLAKEALTSLPRELVECRFNVPDSGTENDFAAALDYVLQNDAWLVDQFLHVNEQTLAMDDVLALLEGTGLTLDEWIGADANLSAYTKNPELLALFDRLSGRDKLITIDLLLKPSHYVIAARKRD
jgi:2-polyprenyl-3-methyl-5-hydroxy-6-metoxy-1,4-benzoquinol methylase